jgi:DNA modification methylase
MLNDDFELKNSGFSNYTDNKDLPRHRWYYYKEGFSPNLVKQAIDDYGLSNEGLLIDPFNGSGTTTLTASLNGYPSVGMEVNPFTSYLAKTKQVSTDPSKVHDHRKELLNSVKNGATSPLLKYSTFSEKTGRKKWLFNSEVLNSFEGGWQHTNEISSYHVKRIFRLALIIAAMKNCNARKDGKCLRYRPKWNEKDLGKATFIQELDKILDIIEEDLSGAYLEGKAKLLNVDVRDKMPSINKIDGFNLCVTSPPYLNTFDYTDIYRPELFLGKFVKDNKQLYDLRLKTVRSHVQASWKEPEKENFGILYKKAIEPILENKDDLMHKNIPLMIQAYFEDMQRILRGLKMKAAEKASLWLVISTSAYAGIEIPVDLILGEIGVKTGWYLREVGVLRYLKKRKSKYSENITQLRESVVIFDSYKRI